LQHFLNEARPLIAAAYIDYLRQAYYPRPLLLKCGLISIGATSWTLGQLALQSDKPRAFCRATIVCTDGKRPIPLPAALRARLEQDSVLRAEGLPRIGT
jgi:acyl-CoA thioesterase FadM